MGWSGADLRGQNLKKLFAPKKPAFRPWSGSVSAKRTQDGRYIRKANRRNDRDWNFKDYLDSSEADVAIQYHHDWALSGLREIAAVDYAAVSADHSFLYGGQVTRKAGYGDWNGDDRYSDDAGRHVDEYSVSIAEDPDAVEAGDDESVLASSAAGLKTVEQLVSEYCRRGGLVTICPPGARSRKVRLKGKKKAPPSEPVWEEPIMTRPGITPLPRATGTDPAHYMPRYLSQARYRRLWRWARDVLDADEAIVLEDIVLHGRAGDVEVLRSGLKRLSDHFARRITRPKQRLVFRFGSKGYFNDSDHDYVADRRQGLPCSPRSGAWHYASRAHQKGCRRLHRRGA
jgi:hypothetical protein